MLTVSARSAVLILGKADMEFSARPSIIHGVAVTSISLLLGSLALAQSPQRLKNIELCNGTDRTIPQSQINGCTALIDSGNENCVVSSSFLSNSPACSEEISACASMPDNSLRLATAP